MVTLICVAGLLLYVVLSVFVALVFVRGRQKPSPAKYEGPGITETERY